MYWRKPKAGLPIIKNICSQKIYNNDKVSFKISNNNGSRAVAVGNRLSKKVSG
jgi:hypothetical protein